MKAFLLAKATVLGSLLKHPFLQRLPQGSAAKLGHGVTVHPNLSQGDSELSWNIRLLTVYMRSDIWTAFAFMKCHGAGLRYRFQHGTFLAE